MQTTFHFPIPADVAEAMSADLTELRRLQSTMVRVAYKVAMEKLTNPPKDDRKKHELGNELCDILRPRYKGRPGYKFALLQHAVKSAIGSAKADIALADGSFGFKTRIWGGKKNFIDRAQGKITAEEWKEKRLLPLYFVGEAGAAGNRFFDFADDAIICKLRGGWNKNCRFVVLVPELKKKRAKIWSAAVAAAMEKKLPITVSVTGTTLSVTFDTDKLDLSGPKWKEPVVGRFAGIDMNPNYIGVSIHDGDVVIASKMWSLIELTGKHSSADKLKHETREVAHAVGRFLKHHRVEKLFVEELGFKPGNKGKGKAYNRLVINKWPRNAFVAVLKKYFSEKKKKYVEIFAHYTSVIGNILNPEFPDPIASSIEVARRGRRITTRKPVFPPAPSHDYLLERLQMCRIKNGSAKDVPVLDEEKWWVQLNGWFKNAGVLYRVPIPKDGFQAMSSRRSQVHVLQPDPQ